MPLRAPTDFSKIDIQIYVKGHLLSQEEADSLFAAIHDALHSISGLAVLYNMGAEQPGMAPPVRINARLNNDQYPWSLAVPAERVDDEVDPTMEYLSQTDVI
jgi:hypothetical protein